jgi:MYXO-CTERM domain-containing protein
MRIARAAALSLVGLLSSEAAAEDPVVIVAPLEDAVVPPSFTVTVEFGDIEHCDLDGCTKIPANAGELFVDGSPFTNCFDCQSPVDFDISLEPGPHTLRAAAVYGPSFNLSKFVHVIVEEDLTTGTTGESTTSDESTGSDDPTSSTTDASTTGTTDPSPDTSVEAPPPETDGCACDAGTDASGPAWLAVVCLFARRVRRRP